MKYLVAAIALAFAFPAAAQTAPAQHQGHDQHAAGQQAQPSGTEHQGHGQHQPGHHEGHGDGCCADRNNNGRMDCCENMTQGQGGGAERTPEPALPQGA